MDHYKEDNIDNDNDNNNNLLWRIISTGAIIIGTVLLGVIVYIICRRRSTYTKMIVVNDNEEICVQKEQNKFYGKSEGNLSGMI